MGLATGHSIKEKSKERRLLDAKYTTDKIKLTISKLNLILNYTDPNLAYNTFLNIITYNFIKEINQTLKKHIESKLWLTAGIKTSINIRNNLFRKKQNI